MDQASKSSGMKSLPSNVQGSVNVSSSSYISCLLYLEELSATSKEIREKKP